LPIHPPWIFVCRTICPEIVDVREGEGNSTDGEEESQRATKEEMNNPHQEQLRIEHEEKKNHIEKRKG
jgi:hypothetical protein